MIKKEKSKIQNELNQNNAVCVCVCVEVYYIEKMQYT